MEDDNANVFRSISETVEPPRTKHNDKLPPLKSTRTRDTNKLPKVRSAHHENTSTESGLEEHRPKTRRKSKSRVQLRSGFDQDSVLAGHIQDLGDDIVEDEPPTITQTAESATSINRTSSRVYLQCTYGFKEISKVELQNRIEQQQDPCRIERTTKLNVIALNVALNTQVLFHKLCNTCHGLLAGIAVAHCIMVMFMQPPYFPATDFFQHCIKSIHTFHSIFYILHTICLISILDRCDVGQSSTTFVRQLGQCNPIAFLVPLYAAALILSLVAIKTEDKFPHQLSLLSNETFTVPVLDNTTDPYVLTVYENELAIWWYIVVIRAAIDVVGWLIFASFEHPYRLVLRLKEMLPQP